MKQIASRDNPYFKALKKLCTSGRERRKAGRIVLEGMHLIEAYQSHYGAAEEIVVSRGGSARRENADYLAACPLASTVTVLDDSLFGELATLETPSGIMAVVPWPKCAHGLDQQGDAVLLDGVQDPGNLGSILRTAAAAGFRQVLLSGDCAQAWSPKVLRAAMGAHFQLDIHENSDLPAFLGAYQGQAIVTQLGAATSLYALDMAGPVAWVMGSEGQGVRAEVAAAASAAICIPMPGGTESLNVAAAAAICLFETVRQRDARAQPAGQRAR